MKKTAGALGAVLASPETENLQKTVDKFFILWYTVATKEV